RRGEAIQSLVSAGCIISGASVRRSVVFSNCKIRSHSVVEQSVILPDSEIMRDCVLNKVIVDRGTTVPTGTTIGVDHAEDLKRGFRVTEAGCTLVTPEMFGQKLHHTR
ncbi:MAG TPA: hypothetical protein VFG52_12360, partial [Xanthomonadales bacterium]|nr:hypothetical protein [Xanthomonadales bacterium]